MRSIKIVSIVAALTAASSAVFAQATPAAASRAAAAERNPRRLEVVQLLDQRAPGNLPRVRFQWDQVPGATQYILSGKWTTPPSWTIHSGEYRVTQKIAAEWNDEKVSFEASLPAGSHSWQLVAMTRSATSGDFEHPALKSFEIK